MNVIELRNYLMKPGQRDNFNDYFSMHFIESQAVRGAHVLGKFAVAGQPDKFFWVRGFENMRARSKFLPDFYGGPVWKEFGSGANEMIVDSDDVYLLKPLDGSAPFRKDKVLEINYYFAKDETPEKLAGSFHALPKYEQTTLWTSELQENDFPALPAFQYENLLVSITGFGSEEEHRSRRLDPEIQIKLEPLITKKESLLLYEI